MRHDPLMAPTLRRPTAVIVFYRGLAYELNLVTCRRALVTCQVRGELDSMEALAAKVGLSRSTASRFFSGRPTSLRATLKVLEALHLRFDDLTRPIGDRDRVEGRSAISLGTVATVSDGSGGC